MRVSFFFCEPETLTSSIARSRLQSLLNVSLRKTQIATSRLLTLRDCETTLRSLMQGCETHITAKRKRKRFEGTGILHLYQWCRRCCLQQFLAIAFKESLRQKVSLFTFHLQFLFETYTHNFKSTLKDLENIGGFRGAAGSRGPWPPIFSCIFKTFLYDPNPSNRF